MVKYAAKETREDEIYANKYNENTCNSIGFLVSEGAAAASEV